MPTPPKDPPLGDQLEEWLERGPKKLTIDDETMFVKPHILKGVLESKVFILSLLFSLMGVDWLVPVSAVFFLNSNLMLFFYYSSNIPCRIHTLKRTASSSKKQSKKKLVILGATSVIGLLSAIALFCYK